MSNIDNIFKKGFEDFEPQPPEGSWEHIERAINKKSSSGLVYYYAASVLIILTSVFISYHYFSKPIQYHNTYVAKNNLPFIKKDKNIGSNIKYETGKNINKDSDENNVKSGNQNLQSAIKKPHIKSNKSNVLDKGNEKVWNNNDDLTLNGNERNQILKEKEVEKAGILSDEEEKFEEKVLLSETEQKNLFEEINPGKLLRMKLRSEYLSTYFMRDMVERKVTYYQKPSNHYYIGLAYNLIYNASESKLFSKNEDLANSKEISFQAEIKDRFIIRTGLAFTVFNKDKYDYTLYYKRSEAIGNYIRVDSVDFNTINGNVFPTYYTSKEIVYEEKEVSSTQTIYKRYGYLQIPLSFGYKVHSAGRIFVSLNAGPIFSFNIFKTADGMILPNNASVFKEISNEKTRVRSYVDVCLSMGMNYEINDRLSFTLEPTYIKGTEKYTDSKSRKNNYGVGLRTALMYRIK